MRPENQAKLQKIRSGSIVFRAICKVLMVLVAVLGSICTVCVTLGIAGINYGDTILRTAGLPFSHRLFLGMLTALAFAVLFKCFYHLHRLFGNYSRGEIFTRESVGQLRQFGIACVLWGVMNFIWGISLALSMRPQNALEDHSDAFVIGIILIVIAWFMDMAADLREENELTI